MNTGRHFDFAPGDTRLASGVEQAIAAAEADPCGMTNKRASNAMATEDGNADDS